MAVRSEAIYVDREQLSLVAGPFEGANPLPREAFTDPRCLEFERAHFFRSSWVPVAHIADLERPGDWTRTLIHGEHIVVIRTADLEIVALHAVCRHRGTLLLEGKSGHLDDLSIVCPYHDWAYATDGRNLRAPGARASSLGVDAGGGALDLGLRRASIATFGGVIFVNLDPDAAPLAKSIEASWPPWLIRARLSHSKRVRRVDSEVAANWKVCVGNFQESHHFPHVHPSLDAKTPWGHSTSVIESETWLGGLMELAPGFETVSETGRRADRPFLAASEDRTRVSDAWVWPLWLTSLQPDYLLTYRLAPLAVDRTLVVAEIHVHQSALANDLEEVFTFWDRTNAEDRAICERQQKGLSANGAEPLLYTDSEDGLHAFERIVALRALTAMGAGDAENDE